MKIRESNMELLRIISMMMILIVHMDGAALGLPDMSRSDLVAPDIWKLVTEAAVIIGVNCFTLISGYFGINLRLKSVAGYLFQCVFYSVAIASIAWIVNPPKFGLIPWLQSWLVLTHTDLWFVPAYFWLMLVSPVINAGMAALSRKNNLFITVAFVFYNLWAGWFWEGKFNPTGYTVVQLLMVYMIGRVIALYPRPSNISGIKCLWLYLLAVAGVLWTTAFLPLNKSFAYNSPFVLFESVAFFLTFLSLKLKSRIINNLAMSAFAVYLVHKAPFVWICFFKPLILKAWNYLSISEYSFFVLGTAIVIYLILIPVDWIRRWFFKVSYEMMRALVHRKHIKKRCETQ